MKFYGVQLFSPKITAGRWEETLPQLAFTSKLRKEYRKSVYV